MKYILLLTLLLTTSLYAGPLCMANSKHLEETNDNKEWYYVECNCKCETIKGGYCIECGHLQDAQTYEVVTSKKIKTYANYQKKMQMPDTSQNSLKKLVVNYLLNQ